MCSYKQTTFLAEEILVTNLVKQNVLESESSKHRVLVICSYLRWENEKTVSNFTQVYFCNERKTFVRKEKAQMSK